MERRLFGLLERVLAVPFLFFAVSLYLLVSFFFAFLFRAAPACGSSQTRVESELQLPAQQYWLLNPQPLGSQSDLLTTELGQELPF